MASLELKTQRPTVVEAEKHMFVVSYPGSICYFSFRTCAEIIILALTCIWVLLHHYICHDNLIATWNIDWLRADLQPPVPGFCWPSEWAHLPVVIRQQDKTKHKAYLAVVLNVHMMLDVEKGVAITKSTMCQLPAT